MDGNRAETRELRNDGTAGDEVTITRLPVWWWSKKNKSRRQNFPFRMFEHQSHDSSRAAVLTPRFRGSSLSEQFTRCQSFNCVILVSQLSGENLQICLNHTPVIDVPNNIYLPEDMKAGGDVTHKTKDDAQKTKTWLRHHYGDKDSQRQPPKDEDAKD